MNKVKLTNVIDIRTNQFYSVVIVSEKKARFFVPVNDDSEEDLMDIEGGVSDE